MDKESDEQAGSRESLPRRAFRYAKTHKFGTTAVIALLGAIASLIPIMDRYNEWRSREPPERAAVRAVSQLSPGSTIENFRTKLGGEPQTVRQTGELQELLWVSKQHAVQAFADSRIQRVVGYTVTARSPKFRPPIPFLGQGERLGKARFTAFPASSLYVDVQHDARGNFWYVEAVPGSGATKGDSLLLGAGAGYYTQAGSRHPPDRIYELVRAALPAEPHKQGPLEGPVDASQREIAEARGALVVTTYGVFDDSFSFSDLTSGTVFGLHPDDARRFPAER